MLVNYWLFNFGNLYLIEIIDSLINRVILIVFYVHTMHKDTFIVIGKDINRDEPN